ncbi:S-layer homology domain-containing protein [Brevibacillus centrosporus]|uniref:S-layer homology domain-containing protein n=1 Tax=Brevibacillus centrosporus TaxID=54910 RepID=A0A1I3KLU1_9BACL|nr:S-layer homology domain-containing protein [Brevibacillus centrosporus]SFI73407.1 S-layer homology domain-containing protein [Brevibacillus centrosporus]
MKSRFLMALPIAAVLTLSIGQQSFAATPFADINQVAEKNIIIDLQEKGYVHGVDEQRYMPEALMTAAQGFQLIVNALKLEADPVKSEQPIQNVDPDEWYADVLQIAAQNGIEMPADFDPNRSWTREDFIYHLMLSMEHKYPFPMIKIAPVEFADSDELTLQYQGAVQRAIVRGIVKLDEDRMLHPKDELSRADAAELIYQAIAYLDAHPGPAVEPTQP